MDIFLSVDIYLINFSLKGFSEIIYSYMHAVIIKVTNISLNNYQSLYTKFS